MHHDDTDTAVLITASDPELVDDRPRMPGDVPTGELSEVEKALAVLAVLDGDWQGA